MTKQSIEDFFEPSGKLFAISFLSILVVWFIFASSGITILGDIADVIFLLYSGNTFVIIFWFLFVSYVLSCLLAKQYSKFKKNRQSFPVPKNKFQVVRNLLTMILLLFLFSIIFVFNNNGGSNSKAKNSRIIAAITQARDVMASEFSERGSYDFFSCGLQDMNYICSEVAKFVKEDGNWPVIALNRRLNSDSACFYSPLNYIQKSGWFYYLKDKFKEKTRIWYCADSSGKVGETKIDPGSAGYCVDGQSAVCPLSSVNSQQKKDDQKKAYRDPLLNFSFSFDPSWELSAKDGTGINDLSGRTISLSKNSYEVEILAQKQQKNAGDSGGLLEEEDLNRYDRFIIDGLEIWRSKPEWPDGNILNEYGYRLSFLAVLTPTKIYEKPEVFGKSKYIGTYSKALNMNGKIYEIFIKLPFYEEELKSGLYDKDILKEIDAILQSIKW